MSDKNNTKADTNNKLEVKRTYSVSDLPEQDAADMDPQLLFQMRQKEA